jgi:hypothetical protein
MEGRAKNASRLVKEIKTMKDSWLKLFEEAKRVASNLGIDPELKRGWRIRKKKRFFDGTGIFFSGNRCSSQPWICLY